MTIADLSLSYDDFRWNDIIDPDAFDQNNYEITLKVNTIIDIVNQITDSIVNGSSGADAISLTAIEPFVSVKLQTFLEDVIAQLKNTTDGESGADFVSSTSIEGVIGNTIQEQLESLKDLLDVANTALTTHKTSNDHDDRYYTELEVDNKLSVINENVSTHKTSNDHDDRYYTELEVDSKLAYKSDVTHGHSAADIGAVATLNGVSGQDINFVEGTGIQIVGNDSNDTITITATSEAIPGYHMHSDEEVNLSEERDLFTSLNLAGVLGEIGTLYSEYASFPDVNGTYTNVEFRRPDGTNYMKSMLLSMREDGNYRYARWDFYAADGSTVIKKILWSFFYDDDGNLITKYGSVSDS